MIYRRSSRLLPLLAGIILLAAGPAAASSGWAVVPSPNPSSHANYLVGLEAISPTDMWAVGSWYRPSSTPGTLTQHWNGSTWTTVPSPNATVGYNELYGVAAVSSTDMWAVGYHNISDYGSEKTMALHWNGVRWRIVRTRNIGTEANAFADVAALAAGDVWAVGFGDSTSNEDARPLVEHWNGTRWTLVPTPRLGEGYGVLNGIAAVAPDDIWAVGAHDDRTLIEHWDGASWSVVPSPNGARPDNELYDVTALGPNDVWAVGESEGSNSGDSLVLHWDGTSWTVVPSQDGASIFTSLNEVVAIASNDVWAVGTTYNFITVEYRTFTEHWDGTQWTVVESPNSGNEVEGMNGADTTPAGDVWAVGAAGGSTLTMRYVP